MSRKAKGYPQELGKEQPDPQCTQGTDGVTDLGQCLPVLTKAPVCWSSLPGTPVSASWPPKLGLTGMRTVYRKLRLKGACGSLSPDGPAGRHVGLCVCVCARSDLLIATPIYTLPSTKSGRKEGL